jgi:hypothetical protein
MGRNNEVIAGRDRPDIGIEVFKAEILQPQFPGMNPRSRQRSLGTIDTDELNAWMPARVKGRQDPWAASEVEDGCGLGKPLGNQRSNCEVECVALTVQNGQDGRCCGAIVEGRFVRGIEGVSTLLGSDLLKTAEITGGDGLSLPSVERGVRVDTSQSPPCQVFFEHTL